MADFTLELAKELVTSQEQFPIDFEDAYLWLDYSRKDNAKTSFLKCGFIEGVDYTLLRVKERVNGNNGGGIVSKETIYLTVDCFKHWGMMINSEKGRQIRLYFLECEKQLKTITTKPKSAIELFEYHLNIAKEHEQRLLQIEENNKRLTESQEVLEAETDFIKETLIAIDEELSANTAELERFSNGHGTFYSIAGWCSKIGLKKDLPWMTRQGRLASARTRNLGITPVKVNDPRYGTVNTYPDSVLETLNWE